MMNKFLSIVLFLCVTSAAAFAEDQTKEAAVGGGVGGAIGGAIGAEIDGRNGAIIGAGVGAAVGAAVATEGDKSQPDHKGNAHTDAEVNHAVGIGHPKGYHCPPGQAKKGRC